MHGDASANSFSSFTKGVTRTWIFLRCTEGSQKAVLPSVYSPEEIRKIESSVDTSSVSGKRNLCILLLASRLVMRSGDIVKLSFSEVDFGNGRINYIQEKPANRRAFLFCLKWKTHSKTTSVTEGLIAMKTGYFSALRLHIDS